MPTGNPTTRVIWTLTLSRSTYDGGTDTFVERDETWRYIVTENNAGGMHHHISDILEGPDGITVDMDRARLSWWSLLAFDRDSAIKLATRQAP